MKDSLYTISEAADYLELPVKIIRSMEKDSRLTVRDHVYIENSDELFKELYNITVNSKTQLYTTQPYASLNIYWQMVTWRRARKYPIDQDLMHQLTARY